MIHDVVCHNGRAFRIHELGTTFCTDVLDNLADTAALRPYPLSCELLEMNGFRYDEDEEVWRLYEPDGIFYTLELGTNDDNSLNIKEVPNTKLIYVHELQHVLRLCDKVDLANNFIVY